MTLSFQWLGVAGLAFSYQGQTLLIDPFFTRPSGWTLLSGRRVQANRALAARHAPRSDYVLITHPHYDHLLDVPEVLRQTGAQAYGSPNACALLALHGVAEERVSCIRVGDRLMLGSFGVEVFPAQHTRTPLDGWLNGPLPDGLKAPAHLLDYRMDACYSFRLHVGDKMLLVGNYPIPADVLFISPYHSAAYFAHLLREISPSRVVPIHWDAFMRPLTKPIRPMLITWAQGLKGFLPVRRLDLRAFRDSIQSAHPGIDVLIPEIFQSYPLQ